MEEAYQCCSQEQILNHLEITEKYSLAYLNLMNNLEIFSTYFIQEVADESVAFDAVGSSFCYIVRQCSLQLCFLSKKKHLLYFQNIIKLNKMWNERLEIRGINLQKENIEKMAKEKLDELEKELESKDNKKIKPLGT